ncbi:hypothetical protein, partial [Viridibacillus soli]|uniref:hypothetical protein n=1 Tax=Viridibacillus soli TaxID=2798301 RepID=UPI001F467D07
ASVSSEDDIYFVLIHQQGWRSKHLLINVLHVQFSRFISFATSLATHLLYQDNISLSTTF